MAAKTNFSETALREILSNYPLGEYIHSRAMVEGTVQTNFFIQTTLGRYIFRYYENRSKESVRFECNLLRYLKVHNYPCPAPVKNIHGLYIGICQDKPFVIFEFVDGQHLENPSPEQEQQLIQKVAELQNLTRHYRPASWQQRMNYGPVLCRDLAHQAAQRINTENARKKLAWYLEALEELDLPRQLPKGICHCDFHFSNILFKDGKFAALIDFDDANYTYLTFDLITLMNPFVRSFDWNTWQKFDPGADIFDFGQARSVVGAYEKYRPLSPVEKRHLFDVYKLSVLIDCLWYFERGAAIDFFERRKIDALNRLGREVFYQQVF